MAASSSDSGGGLGLVVEKKKTNNNSNTTNNNNTNNKNSKLSELQAALDRLQADIGVLYAEHISNNNSSNNNNITAGALQHLSEGSDVSSLRGDVQEAPEQLRQLLCILETEKLQEPGQQEAETAGPTAPKKSSSKTSRTWQRLQVAACRAFVQLLPFILTLPFYVCGGYREWYIDETFAIVHNQDVWPHAPWRNLLTNDFWGQPLWPQGNSSGSTWTHKSFRPLTSLSFRLQLAGQDKSSVHPGSLRVASCAIHSLNVLLLQLLMRNLRIHKWWVVLATSLFAVHPVHLENLPYLVGRADSLATCFMLCGLLLRQARCCRSFGVSLLGVLAPSFLSIPAGLCKETGFMLPAVTAWHGLTMGHFGLALLDTTFFAVIAAARWMYVGGASVGFSFVDTPIQYSESQLVRMLSYLQQHSRYMQLMVLPWHLSWDYSFDALPLVGSFEDLRLLGVLAAYGLLVSFAAWLAAARSRIGALALGMIALPFLPCSNLFFIVGTTVAERLLYPCTVGWVLALAHLGTRMEQSRSCRPSFRLTWRFLAVILIMLFAYRSAVRTNQWRSKVALFHADMLVWHRSAKVSHQFASLLHGGGRLEEAIAHYSRSLEIHDDNALTDYCIAHCLLQLESYTEAGQRFDKIMAGHGIGFGAHNSYVLHLDRGWLLAKVGRHADALPILEQGLRQKPDFAGRAYAWNALGVVRAKSGDLQGAMDCLLKGPVAATIWSNTAAVAAAGGASEEAAQAARTALALAPTDPETRLNARILAGGPGTHLGIPLPGEKPSMRLFFEA